MAIEAQIVNGKKKKKEERKEKKITGNSSGITPRSGVREKVFLEGGVLGGLELTWEGHGLAGVPDLLREATCKGHVVTTLSDKYFRSTVFALFAG